MSRECQILFPVARRYELCFSPSTVYEVLCKPKTRITRRQTQHGPYPYIPRQDAL